MATGSQSLQMSLLDLIFVGSNITALTHVNARTLVNDQHRAPGVLTRLEMMAEGLASLELAFTEAALLDDLTILLRSLQDTESSATRLGSNAQSVRNLARRVSNALEKEAAARTTFVVKHSRDQRFEKLLLDPAAFFGVPPEGPIKLEPHVTKDFQEAARCYAVGFISASIMFIYRATEGVIRHYFKTITGLNKSQPIGKMTKTLKIPVLRCPEQVTDKLRDISIGRNQFAHPHKLGVSAPTEQEASRIMAECQTAIEAMIDDLASRQS